MIGAVASYALKAAIPRRRLLLLLPVAGCVLFALLGRIDADRLEDSVIETTVTGIFGLVLPITALIVGDALLGAEIRAGTFAFTWLSPVPAWTIVIGRWLGGVAAVGVYLVPASLLAATLAGTPGLAGPLMVGVAAGGAAYLGVFFLFGALMRRAVVASLVFVFLVERALGAVLGPIAQLSPSWHGAATYVGLARDGDDLDVVTDGLALGYGALAGLGVISVVTLVLTTLRLPRRSFAGATD